ncbi:MAG TPA: enoyl-CoA hydratase/isomerase family protein [Pseudolabrys sp.]|nr:enoyl-CoA hydratase/isomerase family protein [Pseudolabrys sp.]
MIDVAINDGIAVVTMRHGKANALDIELCDALAARFHSLRNGASKAVVLTGQGKIFSAGVDLIRVGRGGAPYIRDFLPALHKLYEAVFFHPKPVVAAINGHAIAGGCVLALCADRRVMVKEGGTIGVTELLVGVPFPVLAFEIMRHATPPAFFNETILSGATFPPEVALHRQWVNDLAEPGDIMERAVALAQELASLSPLALAQTKAQIRQPASERIAQSARLDAEIADIWCAPEALARIRDYVARTLKKR